MCCNFRHIITGSYQNRFRIFNLETQADYTLEASRELYPTGMGRQPMQSLEDVESGKFDTVKKQLHSAWHPRENVIALAASDNLYLFAGLDPDDPPNPTPSAARLINPTNLLSNSGAEEADDTST